MNSINYSSDIEFVNLLRTQGSETKKLFFNSEFFTSNYTK